MHCHLGERLLLAQLRHMRGAGFTIALVFVIGSTVTVAGVTT